MPLRERRTLKNTSDSRLNSRLIKILTMYGASYQSLVTSSHNFNLRYIETQTSTYNTNNNTPRLLELLTLDDGSKDNQQ